MPSHDLGSVSCVVLKNFNDLHTISFGINLALPIFRELIIFNRRKIVTRLPALQSIIEGRTYTSSNIKQEHIGEITKVKINLMGCDQDLSDKINICSVITFLFSLASLFWLNLGIYNPQCLSPLMVFFSVWLNFLPLPLSIAFLAWKSSTLYSEINHDLDTLLKKVM